MSKDSKDEVQVQTNGDDYAVLEHGMAMVELSKDGDSPSCPRSWTWDIWYDGNSLDSTCDESSLAQSVSDVTASLDGIIQELTVLRDYLKAFGAFGRTSGRVGEGGAELPDKESEPNPSLTTKFVLAGLPDAIEVEVNGVGPTALYEPKRPKAKPVLASQRDGADFYFDDCAVCGACGQPLTNCGIPYPLNYVWQRFCPRCGAEVDR